MKSIVISALFSASMMANIPSSMVLIQPLHNQIEVTIEAQDGVSMDAAENAKKFYDLFFVDAVTPKVLRGVFQPSSYAGGYDRLMRVFSFLKNHFVPVDKLIVYSLGGERYALRLLKPDGSGAVVELHMPRSEDYLVGEFNLRPWQPATAHAEQGLTDFEIIDRVDTYLEDLATREEFSGVVAIAKNGMPIYKTFLGLADREQGRPMTMDTPINIGSMNKMWTALAISQLVSEGKIGWHDPVGKFLPDYPNARVQENVTIHHLLNHKSGIFPLFNQRYMDVRNSNLSVEDLMMTFASQPLLFEPGSEFRYSNSGPVVLGRIIEVVSDMDFYDYNKANILDKAGMRNSGFFRNVETNSGKAIGYLRDRDEQGHSTNTGPWRPNTNAIGSRGKPAGGAYASGNDMLRFARALKNNRLVGPEEFEILTTSHLGDDPDSGYGYLFGVHSENGHKYVGHNGGGPGIQADFNLFTELGFTIVVLSNYDGAATPVSQYIRNLIVYGKTANAYDAGH